MLFQDSFTVYAEFEGIASLERGATVRVAGMQAGEVQEINVPTSPSGRFRVRMRVRDDLRPLLRLDSVASIQNDGLVGNKFVQIEPGSEQSSVVSDGGTIRSREPFDLADLLAKMNDTIDTVNGAVVDVQTELQDALTSISATATTAQTLMDDLGRDVVAITASGEKIASDLQAIVSGVRQGRGTVGQLMTDDTLYQRAKTIADEAEQAMTNVRRATEDAREAIAGLRGENGPVQGLTGDLQRALTSARDAMADLAENTEALKHNFLFRGFFNRRGYFDLDDVTPEQYRSGALETASRKALRIWIGAGVLFERDASGAERLSEGGRARIDSAMSEFVKYPKSPLVVEGYAAGVTGDERYVASKTRANLVRDYIVGKFALDPNLVAIMPLGPQAKNSPDGETWNGVALAVFVPTAAL
jgi:phospholipid/cholesterol/gamma-HCH transport system substrate-binding protein